MKAQKERRVKPRFIHKLLLCIPLFCLFQDGYIAIAQNGQIVITGQVTDAANDKALAYVNITVQGTTIGSTTDLNGRYSISVPSGAHQLQFSLIGFRTQLCPANANLSGRLNIRLSSLRNTLAEVKISSGKRPAYRNKGNPAVELIRQVIAHKSQNRQEHEAYLQFAQYERLNLTLTNLSARFLNGKFFKKYRFLLDSLPDTGGRQKTVLPIYMSEKNADVYERSAPAKTITVKHGQKEVNLGAVIDSAGFDVYLNRLYGDNIELYNNDIFVLTKQFLSPIADLSPNFYKFFITDTLQEDGVKFIRLAFTPRAKGDLLFEGTLQVTLDGRYAVRSASLGINKLINLNFLRSFHIDLDFEQQPNQRYFLKKSRVQADFGIFQNKGFGVSGVRTVVYDHYVLGKALPDDFYKGPESRTIASMGSIGATADFSVIRPDTLTPGQSRIYKNFDSLQHMPSYRRMVWLSKTIIGGYADVGPFQIGPDQALYSYNPLEGSRFTVGGRSTPQLNKNIYFEGYTAYGALDEKLKYYLSTAWSFNQLPYYQYPSNFIRAGYQYDTDIPGQNFLITKSQSPLASISRGRNDLWQYNRIFNMDYIKDFENHMSIDLGIRQATQMPADQLVFLPVKANSMPVNRLNTSEARITFRYAPHEKIFQGTMERHTIYSKYPIITTQFNYGIKGFVGGEYQYLNASGNIFKRLYLSQFGYTDITLLGGVVFGKVPFPILSILPANQTYLYNRDEYNMMNFLEFVTDHYAGLNLTHSFNGFLLNKIPGISHLELREYLSFKVLYGGLRRENDPMFNTDIYRFPVNSQGMPLTYKLGSTPYIEIGVGLGNIFKLIRVEAIRRINYLNHPNVAEYGLRFNFVPDL